MGGFSQLLSNVTAICSDAYGMASDHVKELSKELSSNYFGELTALGFGQYILCPIAGTLFDWASIISEYENIHPESTKAIANFFNSSVAKEYIGMIPPAMHAGIINEIDICSKYNTESIELLAEKLAKKFFENVIATGASALAGKIPFVDLVQTIWNISKLGATQKALDAADSFQTSSYSVFLQSMSGHAMYDVLMKCNNEENQENLINILTVSLKSGYIARVEAIDYLNKTLKAFNYIDKIIYSDSYYNGISELTEECEEIADMIATLEYSECSKLIDESIRGKRFLLQDDYNKYLISKLFPDLLPPPSEPTTADMPQYIVYSDGNSLYKYDLSNNKNTMIFSCSTNLEYGSFGEEIPTGGIYDIHYHDGYIYFQTSAGQDGIPWYALCRVDLNGENYLDLSDKASYSFSDSVVDFYDDYIIILDYRTSSLGAIDYNGNLLYSFESRDNDMDWAYENIATYANGYVYYVDYDGNIMKYNIATETVYTVASYVLNDEEYYEVYYVGDNVLYITDRYNGETSYLCLIETGEIKHLDSSYTPIWDITSAGTIYLYSSANNNLFTYSSHGDLIQFNENPVDNIDSYSSFICGDYIWTTNEMEILANALLSDHSFSVTIEGTGGLWGGIALVYGNEPPSLSIGFEEYVGDENKQDESNDSADVAISIEELCFKYWLSDLGNNNTEDK